MRTDLKICPCCNEKKKVLMHVSVENASNIFLCKICNLSLIRNRALDINPDYELKIIGKRGDFHRIILVKRSDWFKRTAEARLNAEMDNQPLSDIFW